MAWQDAFAANRWGDGFGATAGRTSPHKGTDIGLPGGAPLPAWERLTVVDSDTFIPNLGYIINLRADDGQYFGVAHMRKGTRPNNGTVLRPGDTIGLIASGPKTLAQSNANFPGLQWTGPHAHIVQSDDPRAAQGYGNLRNARPRILAAVNGSAPEAGYGFGLTKAAQLAAQNALTKLGLYSGLIDGDFGPLSVGALQQHLKNIGLLPGDYRVDGVPGPIYGRAVQTLAQRFGYAGDLDGAPGENTSAAIERWSASVLAPAPAPEPSPAPAPAPVPVNVDNPRNLPTMAPVYPGAKLGVICPLSGQQRSVKGNPPIPVTDVRIDRYIIHHTASTADQMRYFSEANDRGSCPTWYLRTNGEVIETIRPGDKPASTGAEWNWRSVAVETQNATGDPEWLVTDAQLEAHAQMIAWLASHNGRDLDGVPVQFTIDREHVITHREVGATACPGDYLQSKVDGILARARTILAELYPPAEPEPGPEQPAEPVPPTETPGPEPTPDEEDPVTEPDKPAKVALTDEQLAAILATSIRANIDAPAEPAIPDKVAKPLWIGLSLAAVSVPPLVGLTVIDYAAWSPTVATQLSGTLVTWIGSIAAVLGLSRYGKTKA